MASCFRIIVMNICAVAYPVDGRIKINFSVLLFLNSLFPVCFYTSTYLNILNVFRGHIRSYSYGCITFFSLPYNYNQLIKKIKGLAQYTLH